MGHAVIHAQNHRSKKSNNTTTQRCRVCGSYSPPSPPPPPLLSAPLSPGLSVLVIFSLFAARRPRRLSTRLSAVIQSAVTGRALPDARLEMGWAGWSWGVCVWRVSDSIEMHCGSPASLRVGCESRATRPPRRSGTEAPLHPTVAQTCSLMSSRFDSADNLRHYFLHTLFPVVPPRQTRICAPSGCDS